VAVSPANENHLPTKRALVLHTEGSDIFGHDSFLNFIFFETNRPPSDMSIKLALDAYWRASLV
jgi:hypothetical protein